ncbi:hypothetical protein DYB26_006584 [Aphanomyces astaci]|uniref:Isoleucyl-tRNA synthetase n=2 Tax=Aphanomyces astaci TaxID=112090 RepID=A0A418CRP4_APHAT|nr:hypothetical protein DYB26_006584 [Aphanomyces astaci]
MWRFSLPLRTAYSSSLLCQRTCLPLSTPLGGSIASFSTFDEGKPKKKVVSGYESAVPKWKKDRADKFKQKMAGGGDRRGRSNDKFKGSSFGKDSNDRGGKQQFKSFDNSSRSSSPFRTNKFKDNDKKPWSKFSNDKSRFSNEKPKFSNDKPKYSNDKPKYSNDKPKYSNDKHDQQDSKRGSKEYSKGKASGDFTRGSKQQFKSEPKVVEAPKSIHEIQAEREAAWSHMRKIRVLTPGIHGSATSPSAAPSTPSPFKPFKATAVDTLKGDGISTDRRAQRQLNKKNRVFDNLQAPAQDTLEPLLNDTTISHVQKVMLEHGGTDAWWTQPLATLLAPGFVPAQYVKGTDTLDVWFDSGSSWYAVLPKDTVADVYLEGSDQHRGWFQSSLLTSLAVQRKAPYKNVITHGFILDERGQKMSKSLGNVLVPHDIIEGHPKKKIPAYGVDTLRYWVASTDYTSQVGIGPSTMVKISDHVRKVRNTARFLLANLNDFDPRVDAVAYDDMTSLDQYMLHLLHELQAQITDGYETFAFNKVQQALAHFIATDLSAFYMEACKDRLYCEAPTDPFRRSAQTVRMTPCRWRKASKEGWEQVLDVALQTITTAIAPVVCHTAEDIRLHRLAQFTNAIVNDVPGSVFLDGWFSPKIHADGELAAILNQVNPRILEDMLLCSGVTLHALDATTTGETTLVLEKFPVKVVVRPAQGHKCPRCWKFANEVNEAQETLCARCASAVGCSRIHDLVHK